MIIIAIVALYVFRRLFSGTSSKTLVAQAIAQGAPVIDVRTPDEYSSGHFPNARNIPLDRLDSAIAALDAAKESPLIVYCASGMRSAQAARLLAKAGYTKVLNAGGLSSMPRG